MSFPWFQKSAKSAPSTEKRKNRMVALLLAVDLLALSLGGFGLFQSYSMKNAVEQKKETAFQQCNAELTRIHYVKNAARFSPIGPFRPLLQNKRDILDHYNVASRNTRIACGDYDTVSLYLEHRKAFDAFLQQKNAPPSTQKRIDGINAALREASAINLVSLKCLAISSLVNTITFYDHERANHVDEDFRQRQVYTPQTLLREGGGICSDVAYMKMELLHRAGVPAKDLFVLSLDSKEKDKDGHYQGHAVTAVRIEGKFVILNNTNMPSEQSEGSFLLSFYGSDGITSANHFFDKTKGKWVLTSAQTYSGETIVFVPHADRIGEPRPTSSHEKQDTERRKQERNRLIQDMAHISKICAIAKPLYDIRNAERLQVEKRLAAQKPQSRPAAPAAPAPGATH